MATFGIEEEFLLVDPATGLPTPRAEEMSRALAAQPAFPATDPPVPVGQSEFLACQLETSTIICDTLDDAAVSLLGARTAIAAAAASTGIGVVPSGAAPRIADTPAEVTGTERYRAMGKLTGAVAGEHYVNGTHIHVAVPDRDSGINALNKLRPWLSTLAALAGNSPFWRGLDTDFSSWRLIHYRRWSVQGCPPEFADASDYDRRLARLLGSDAVLDSGHIGWAARLSEHYPTVEVRVGDAQLEAADSVLLAAVVRGLVLSNSAAPDSHPDPELLDAGLWQAARYGLGGRLMGVLGDSSAAAEQVDALVDHIRPVLDENGDLAYVLAGVQRMLTEGTGAVRQRAAYAAGGWNGLTGLYESALTAGS
ncbi:YbdK family carboxylate-amine ligase [Arthrobacter sp. BL-252-APC-1A]|uniref:carboxylate-amine ligase n=1 Tax=Arthrobacter sp. BL-252-APC-1A TaxID=2606622 RepID=UPI0012B20E58|nr:YbdK family carboxylate-amine ligase [Arthrobacter sp. BL-252-APC-1A]MSR99281.1 YbdK family carboxylate-amine ligase [Arthrobacter sp. BL-252-APC-1A]